MTAAADALREALRAVRAAVRTGGWHALADDEVLDAVTVAGDLQRVVETALVEGVAEIRGRSTSFDRAERLTTRAGCRNVSELVQRLTRCSAASAGRLERAAAAVGLEWVGLGGQARPPRLPQLRDALLAGATGVDGVLAASAPLLALGDRGDPERVRAADEVIAALASGHGPDGAAPACADELRVHAQVWAMLIDPDGAEPTELRATRLRGITFGQLRDGVIPVRGALLPEIAAQWETIADATTSPRVRFSPDARTDDGSGAILDDRTRPQKLHDALATALTVAAASRDLPTVGGGAPTLVVSVRENDLTSDTGWAHLDRVSIPVALSVARHVGCGGVVQRVAVGATGRIRRLGSEERVFNRHQRRAIALRDGGCAIPGCHVPAAWCEIHHVVEHAQGGPTHTDNGVLLCWFHHRFIDAGPWRIRMNNGVPEVLPPPWYDPDQAWRATTKSPTRMLERIHRRT